MPELRPEGLAADIKAGAPRPVYYLAGEEKLRRDAAAAALVKAVGPDDFNLQEFSGESASADDLVSSANTPPMFSSRRVLLVKRADALRADARKALTDYLAEPLATTVLILSAEERPKKGDALMSAALGAGAYTPFYALKPHEAEAWVEKEAAKAGRRLSRDAVQLLVDEAGTELHVLRQELDKLFAFTQGQAEDIRPEQALESLGYRAAEDVFDLGRAVEKRDAARALKLLTALVDQGEEPIGLLRIVSMAIEKQWKAKRLLAAGRGEADLFSELRLNRWFDKDFMSHLPRVSEARLLKDLQRCMEADARLKSAPQASGTAEIARILADLGASPAAVGVRR